MTCTCYHCTRERVHQQKKPALMYGQPVLLMKMFLCAQCGNKRCPHATDHRNPCTGSNDPGQKGSMYRR